MKPSSMMRTDTGKMSAVDLFSGCGALSLGLERAGYSVRAAVEINAKCAKTYARNHPDTVVLERDIRTVEGAELLAVAGIGPGELDLVAGCPPCQGFSRIRRRNKKKAVADDRNDLVSEFGRLVLELRPRALMLENVPGLEADRRFKKLLFRLRGAGYRIDWRILRMEEFGIPQRRRRLVMIGSRVANKPDLSQLAKKHARTVRDTIESLPRIPQALRVLHNYMHSRTEAVKNRIRHVPHDGGSRATLPKRLKLKCHSANIGFRDVYGRMAWDESAPTITGGCINPSKGRFLHPVKNRAITLIEAARLQSFPIWYKFDVSDGRYRIAEMIGEALPPRFAATAARYIAQHLIASEPS